MTQQARDVVVVLATCLALFVVGLGIGALIAPDDHDTRASARHDRPDSEDDPQNDSDSANDSGPVNDSDSSSATDGSTAFMTSCGETLDVVPTSAVSEDEAVQVELEFRPVCPDGEWVHDPGFRLVLSDSDGTPYASGSFDFSTTPLYVPGTGEPASLVTARFGPGSAWTAPDSLEDAIGSGSVVVECEPSGEETTEPVEDDGYEDYNDDYDPTLDSDSDRSDLTDPEETALEALRRQAEADAPSVDVLDGSWVPQLSSKIPGTYDEYDDKTYDAADIYEQFLELRLQHGDVRLLNSSDWGAFKFDDYWVVIAASPSERPRGALRWCSDRGIDESQCFAKRLLRDGDYAGNTKMRKNRD